MGQNLMSAITKVSIDLPSSLTLSAKTRLVRFRVPTTPRKRRHELFNILHFALDLFRVPADADARRMCDETCTAKNANTMPNHSIK